MGVGLLDGNHVGVEVHKVHVVFDETVEILGRGLISGDKKTGKSEGTREVASREARQG